MRNVLFTLAFLAAGQAAEPLKIVNAVAHQMEDGSMATVPKSFTTGEVVFFSFQLENYSVSPEKKVKLSAKIDALDSKGVRLQEPVLSTVDTEITPKDKEWKPKLRAQVIIPPLALAGIYKIGVKAVDHLNGAEAAAEIPLTVTGRNVAESDTLTVRNFGFYRTEDGPEPLSTPAYRAGDTVWARFDITGYKYGEGNAVDVEYGVSVLSPSGKVLFSQPRAAAEQTASFYPKRYLPNSFNLNIQPKTPPGAFTIVLTVKDNVGDQTYETKQQFSVE
jgi:hypothetical protein